MWTCVKNIFWTFDNFLRMLLILEGENMIFCKYTENKKLAISYQNSNELFSAHIEYIAIYSLKGDCLAFEINEKPYNLSGNAIICASSKDKIKILSPAQADVNCLTFAPEFINVNLSWEIINNENYWSLCKQHEYPNFKLFLERTERYNGIFFIDKEGYHAVQQYMSFIGQQLSERFDEKWSCRSRGYLLQIIVLLNFYHKKYDSDYGMEDFTWDVCKYINLHLNSDLSIKHLSDHFSTNRTTLTKQFKKHIKKTIHEYIKEKRMERIKLLLAFTELTMLEIGIQSGYNDQTYLSKLFQKVMGTTPLKYRIAMRKSRSQKSEPGLNGK